MKENNRQTSPLGRSTEEKQAGLSLPQPSLFTVDGNAYKYYNESAKNISKFIDRLTSKKFRLIPGECFYSILYLHPRLYAAIHFHFDNVGWTRSRY